MNDERNEIGLNIYEWLVHILRHEINNTEEEDTAQDTTTTDNDRHSEDVLFQTVEKKEDKGTILANMVTKQLIHTVVYNKLLRVLNQKWEPQQWDEQFGFVHRPDVWIVPWLPYIASDPSLMPTLVSDGKRMVKHVISYFHRTISSNNNDIYIQICLQTLRGWIGIFKIDTLQHIMSSASVVTRFAHYLSHCTISMQERDGTVDASSSPSSPPPTISNNNHWKTALKTLFQYHQLKLLSDVQFLSLFEGELLPHWADQIYLYMNNHIDSSKSRMLQKDSSGDNADMTDVSNIIETVGQVYIVWKHQIFGSTHQRSVTDDAHPPTMNRSLNDIVPFSPSHELLRNDVKICECFYSVLRMIHTCFKTLPHSHWSNTTSEPSHISNDSKHDDTVPFDVATQFLAQGYRTVYQRRHHTTKQQVSDDLLRMNISGLASTTKTTTTTTQTPTTNGYDPNQTSIRRDSVLEAQVRAHQSYAMGSSSGMGPSFRDVVAEFAREHDLLFQPRLNNSNNGSGSNNTITTTKDGKPIYLLGTIPMYWEHNVAYAYTPVVPTTAASTSRTTTTVTPNRAWQPMSLHEIAQLAKQTTTRIYTAPS
jgi:hypothetical protein